MRGIRLILAFVLLVGMGSVAHGQVALDNEAVMQMTKSGMGEALVLSLVQGQPGTFDLSAPALVELKKAGVTDRVIGAMAGKDSSAGKGPAIANEYDGMDVGVYYKTGEIKEWTQVPSEGVFAKSGGAFKSIATNGIIKQDMNGRLIGPKSKLGLTTPLEFLIITPNGMEATDFTLVKLNEKSDAREFRTKTGGVFHSTEDVSKSAVSFEEKRLAKHTYEVKIGTGIKKGEYAFLAAGLGGASAVGSRGKAYSFHVTE